MNGTRVLVRTLWKESLFVPVGIALGGALLVGLAAQIDVPMYPVPMSLQTFAVSVIGLLCRPMLAAVTLLTYLALGAAGLPLFAGGNSGLAALSGPTAGYLWGFVGMAWMTAWLVGRLRRHSFGALFVAAFLPSLALLVPGVLWLAASTSLTLGAAVMTGAVPFLVGKLVKTTLAVLVARLVGAELERRGVPPWHGRRMTAQPEAPPRGG
ncbi:biotin transport system substrate-specific component [Limimaricola variabilis]|uniref:Biotin transport system substrate-specific component n=1 Tax=Limimaricola variabilis TaxID=1492771 RepID=A0ABR6HRR4_9RHOB|nr:biotin transporter BioY [Limimaricola variabilis]MBB3713253.1 biotin transport system substrate-specific component [Limimaricola variabilis]